MLTVHHLNNSRSQRVLWLLEELGVPYEIKRYERDPKTMLAPPQLRVAPPPGTPERLRYTRRRLTRNRAPPRIS
jgi:glutathione S-transferase